MRLRAPSLIMHQIFRLPRRTALLALLIGGAMVIMQSCGVVGPPLPPEDIGIEAKIRSQKQATEKTTEDRESKLVPLDQEEVSLPPLQPLGAQ
jgi:hypothetical protein